MTHAEATEVKSAPHAAPEPRRWGSHVAYWTEQMIPRAVGLLFLYAGVTKWWDPTKTHRVFAFDGVPEAMIAPLTHGVWAAEVILGLVLLIGIARRRAVVATILVLFVYSVQLGYLIAANNPPKDCGCVALMAKYASAKQSMVLGLVRNALLAGALEWVRLRIVGRAMSAGVAARTAAATGATTEDG